MRRAVIAGILTLWVFMLTALLVHNPKQETPAPQPPDISSEKRDTDAGDWWSIYLSGHKVGFVHHSLRYRPGAVAFRQESVLQLTTLGEPQTIRTTAFGEMTAELILRRLEFTLNAGPTRLHLQATADGDALNVAVAPEREPIVVRGPVFLPIGLRAAATKAPLKAGRSVRGSVFDPLTRTTGVLELRVVGPEPLPGRPDQAVWRIEESWRDVESILWVDQEGKLLREEGPMGLVAVRESKAEAVQLPTDDWDAVEAVSLRIDRPLDRPRQREFLRLRLRGLPAERIPSGGGQSVDGSTIAIRRIAPDEIVSYVLPYSQPDHASDLTPTASIQADHPRIRALAKTIVGPEDDALTAVGRLVDWVYRYLRKVPTASLPDALEVLDMGQGDCNEHAVLLTALARAAGIPARIVGGLVYGEGAFLYHAWTDVWIGQWIPVDAALNQLPADVTHVRLVEGDEGQTMMMGMIGNLSIEVVEDAKSREAATRRQ